jgi:hypothetical protein
MDRPRGVTCVVASGLVSLCVLVPTVVAQDCLELTGHLESSKYWEHVVADEDYVYGSHCDRYQGGEFSVIDVRAPSAPVEVGSLEICADSLVVSGDYAYVDRWYTVPYRGFWGVQVIDISDPTSPFEVDLIMGRGGIAAVSGAFAYTVDPEMGMWVIDISDPASPIEVGFLAAPEGREFRGVEVSGHYAYATSTTLGGFLLSPRQFLDVVDVSDPSTPFVVGSTQVAEEYIPNISGWQADNSRADVAVSGVYAYVSTVVGFTAPPILWYGSDGGLTVVDIRDPSAPVVAAYMHTGPPQQFVVSGRLLFVIYDWDYIGALRVIDIGDPSNPRLVGPPYPPLNPERISPLAICHCDRYLYTIGGVWDAATGSHYSGLQVFDSSGCGRPYELLEISELPIE